MLQNNEDKGLSVSINKVKAFNFVNYVALPHNSQCSLLKKHKQFEPFWQSLRWLYEGFLFGDFSELIKSNLIFLWEKKLDLNF